MEDDETELQNPFPSPPSHYTKYTNHNLKLLSLLHDRTGDDAPNANQREILSDQADVPDWQLTQLEKPRVDWILDEPEAYYDVFGDRWFVKDKVLSLGDAGGNQLYPSDPTIDRRPALRSILRSLLVTYSSLMSSLLLPPPLSPDEPPEWHRHVDWISNLSTNLMAAANDLRPVQARGNLESMMRRQLELRREETKVLHEKCNVLEEKLRDIRSSVTNLPASQTSLTMAPKTLHDETTIPWDSQSIQDDVQLTEIDVLLWAEQMR
ncbi:Mediator of RNA polymerase II transcription subunit 7 [Leucoagaricus sp. SymC.cos]|nr:Mediator of RNA polymerase II transcription subunit 7 [Leucoagaricus sp. SymC.cos]